MKALVVVAYEESTNCQSTVLVSPHDRQDVNDGQVLDELLRSIIQDSPDGIVRPSHNPFHSVYRPEEMAPVDAVRSAGAYKNILVVIRHPDHFMRNNLSDGEDQIESAFNQHPVDLHRPGVVQLAFRLLAHILGGHFSQRDDILSPVVRVEQIERYAAEHFGDLAPRHGSMRAERRQYRSEPLSVKFIGASGQVAGPRVQPAHVGRDRQDTIAPAERSQSLKQAFLQVNDGEIRLLASCLKKKAH